MGHSEWRARTKTFWRGVVLMSPMIGVDASHLWPDWFMKMCAWLFPKALMLPKTIGADLTLLSRDEEMAHLIANNPLGFPYGPRPRTGYEVVRSAERVQREMEKLGETGMALFVLHGSADKTTMPSMSQAMVEVVKKKNDSVDCTHDTVQDGLHSLELDSCATSVIDKCVRWMQQHSG